MSGFLQTEQRLFQVCWRLLAALFLVACVDIDALRERASCDPDSQTCPRAGTEAQQPTQGSQPATAGGRGLPVSGSSGSSGGTGGGGVASAFDGGTSARDDAATEAGTTAATGDAAAGDAATCGAADRCPSEGQLRCVDTELSGCLVATDGCLDWMPLTTCDGGCADDGSSCANCENNCNSVGSRECMGASLRTCQVDARGCLTWGEFVPCNDGVACTEDSCDAQQARCLNEPLDSRCTIYAVSTCVEDYCDPVMDCQGRSVAAACNDGDPCTVMDTCEDRICRGTLDESIAGCRDECPDDPLKSSPGQCGCGVAEDTNDSDGDGTIDCLDSCPQDQCLREGLLTCTAGTPERCTPDGLGCLAPVPHSCDAYYYCYVPGDCVTRAVQEWSPNEGAEPFGAATDSLGNMYVAGLALGSVGGNAYGEGNDAFVTKWDRNGSRQWSVQWGGTESVFVTAIAANSAGTQIAVAIYAPNAMRVGVWSVAGAAPSAGWNVDVFNEWLTYASAILYGPGGDLYVAGRTNIALTATPNAGDDDAFLARLDGSNGDVLWVRQWGTANEDAAYALATDGSVIYVGGNEDHIDETHGEPTLYAYGASGSRLWQRSFARAGQRGFVESVAVDPGGDVVAGGSFYSTGLLAKVSSSNQLRWETENYGDGVAIDSQGNIYTQAPFIAYKFDGDGNPQWHISIEPPTIDDSAPVGMGIWPTPTGGMRVFIAGKNRDPSPFSGFYMTLDEPAPN